MASMGDEFPQRLCDPLTPVTAVLYYRWLAAGLHDITGGRRSQSLRGNSSPGINDGIPVR